MGHDTTSAPSAGDTTEVPFAVDTRVTFGSDREPGTIAAVVMARAEGITYPESGDMVTEPGPRVWEYDVRADRDRRLVSCQPRELELLPVDIDEAAATLANCMDGDGAAAGRIADILLAELVYRRAQLEQLEQRLAEVAKRISACPAPNIADGYDRCPTHGDRWPCPETIAVWLARGLDPRAETRRQLDDIMRDMRAADGGR